MRVLTLEELQQVAGGCDSKPPKVKASKSCGCKGSSKGSKATKASKASKATKVKATKGCMLL